MFGHKDSVGLITCLNIAYYFLDSFISNLSNVILILGTC